MGRSAQTIVLNAKLITESRIVINISLDEITLIES